MVKKSHSSFQSERLFPWQWWLCSLHCMVYSFTVAYLHHSDLGDVFTFMPVALMCNDVWAPLQPELQAHWAILGLADKPVYYFPGAYSKRICFGSRSRSVFVQKGNYVEKDCFLRSCNGIYRGSRPEPGMVEYWRMAPRIWRFFC